MISICIALIKITQMAINSVTDKQLWYSNVIGEGNGTPLQYSCLENPMDGGTWWATVHGVAKSQTQLKQLIIHASIRNIFISTCSVIADRNCNLA